MPTVLPRRLFGPLALLSTLVLTLPAQARTGPDSFAPLIKRVLPSVVSIAITETVTGQDPLAGMPPELQRQFRERFRKRSQEVQGAGSGFIIDPSGIIVSNNHVVGQATKIVVALSDGTELPATLIGTDELTDVAVIQVHSPTPLPAVSWGDSKILEVGDWVLAAGNPFALGGSVTAGIVSARGRDIGAGPFDDFLQIDASINPGNSGGPLFNEDGQVVGMNSAIYSPTGGSVGIGFAIPSDLVHRIVDQLVRDKHIDRGWLGVSLEEVPSSSRKPAGVTITSVDRSGPAAKSGMRPGDVVTTLNGQALDGSRSLTRAVALTAPGKTIQLTVRRQGHDVDVAVTVGKRPHIEEN